MILTLTDFKFTFDEHRSLYDLSTESFSTNRQENERIRLENEERIKTQDQETSDSELSVEQKTIHICRKNYVFDVN